MFNTKHRRLCEPAFSPSSSVMTSPKAWQPAAACSLALTETESSQQDAPNTINTDLYNEHLQAL